MLGQAFVLFVLAGTSYAAYLDLKTSEVPDRVSIALAVGGLLYYGYRSLATGSLEPVAASVIAGTGLFALGWGMYIAGMWGGADAFVLGAVGYALPSLPHGFSPAYTAPWPFPLSLLLTVFLVGAVYSLLYAFYAAAGSDEFVPGFLEELEERRDRHSRLVLLYVGVVGLATLALYSFLDIPLLAVARNFAASLLVLVAFLFLTVFLRTVESRVMEREVDVEDLEEGEVLAEEVELEAGREDAAEELTDRMLERVLSVLPFSRAPGSEGGGRIAGLTAAQVEELRDGRETVRIRTGVRFIPSFPIAVAILLFFGDPLFFILLQTL